MMSAVQELFATAEQVRSDFALYLVRHGHVTSAMGRCEVRHIVDHSLTGISEEIRAEVYRKVMDLL